MSILSPVGPPLPVAGTGLVAPASSTWSVRTAGPALLRTLQQHYRTPGALRTMLFCSVVLSYGGGAVMFWFHCTYRGEAGPAISPWPHWLLDSSLGFVALTPVVAVLLPLCQLVSRRTGAGSRPGRTSLLLGPAFAVTTGPGPVVHNLLVGRHTALADLATQVVGRVPVADHVPAVPHSALVECLLQVAVGVPLYTVLVLLVLWLRLPGRPGRPRRLLLSNGGT